MTQIGHLRSLPLTAGNGGLMLRIQLIAAERKKILGAALLGIGGDEIVNSILDVMYAGAPYTTI